MSISFEGVNFHSYLLIRLMSRANHLHVVQQILKPYSSYITKSDRARETFALFAKLNGPEPFAHMCALALELVEQPFVWPIQYRVDNSLTIKIPEAVVSLLYDLGRLVKIFPILSYLGLTLDEYIERRVAFKLFFSDIQYAYLHTFWRGLWQLPTCELAAKWPVVLTPQLCEQIKSNLWLLLRKLLKHLLLEKVNGSELLHNESIKHNFSMKLLQDLNRHFSAALLPQIGVQLKETVMIELIAINRVRHLATHMLGLMPTEFKTQVRDKLRTFGNFQVAEKMKALRGVLPADCNQQMVKVFWGEEAMEKGLLSFLVRSLEFDAARSQDPPI